MFFVVDIRAAYMPVGAHCERFAWRWWRHACRFGDAV